MAYDYDRLYRETRNALGEPTKIFVEFFDKYAKPSGRILDIGCGQGRDAIFIARLGHTVIGVDLSSNGIRDLRAVAKEENLAIEGVVADITSFEPPGIFDVILVDRTLHMLTRWQCNSTLSRVLDHGGENAWLLIADERSNMDDFRSVILTHHHEWIVEYEERGYLFARRKKNDLGDRQLSSI